MVRLDVTTIVKSICRSRRELARRTPSGTTVTMRLAATLIATAVLVVAQASMGPALAAAPGGDAASAEATTGPIAKFVQSQGLDRIDGFLPLYRNVAKGTLYLRIPADGGPDLLYQSTLMSGMGSRDLTPPGDGDALDRGRLGNSELVAFRRFGTRVLLIERNTKYYTLGSKLGSPDDAGLSFADAVIASFDVKAEEGNALLIDATDFFRRDGIHVASILRGAGQGNYSIDEKRSAVDTARAHAADTSVEVDALLTFTTGEPPPERNLISRIAADRTALLLRERNALIQLPDLNTSSYRPRIFDPRSGLIDKTHQDPSTLPSGPTRQSFIIRYDLVKKDPAEAVSDPIRPIVFYLDPAMPRSVHKLVEEAVSWWNPAFEAAGYRNVLQVKEPEPGIDLFDANVNAILWVPRETRGYSVGEVVIDPRTGQILKSIVRIDANRMLADRLLFDALTSPYVDEPDFSARDDALQQRFRLLVAHEIGHTLGLRHQYIGSAQGMSSVMDYPFPNIPLDSHGIPDLRHAFPQDVGAWDRAAINYGYHPFPADEEVADLRALVLANERAGLYWMTDQDTNDADPLVQRWDRGTDPIAELEKVLTIRRAALARFSRSVIPSDEPLSVLQDALAPLFLLHQFEVKAVAAMLAGYTYRYAMRDGEKPVPVPMAQQRQALRALLARLDATTLGIDSHILELMSPRPPTFPASSESFAGTTGRIFDAFRPIEDAASLTLDAILQPTRAARLAQAKAHAADAVGLDEVLAAIVARTWKAPAQTGTAGATQRAIALTVLRSLLTCATSRTSPLGVRGACWVALDDISQWMRAHRATRDWDDAFAFASHAITAAATNNAAFELPGRRALVLDPMGEPDQR
jgi:hypothetical protein